MFYRNFNLCICIVLYFNTIETTLSFLKALKTIITKEKIRPIKDKISLYSISDEIMCINKKI